MLNGGVYTLPLQKKRETPFSERQGQNKRRMLEFVGNPYNHEQQTHIPLTTIANDTKDTNVAPDTQVP